MGKEKLRVMQGGKQAEEGADGKGEGETRGCRRRGRGRGACRSGEVWQGVEGCEESKEEMMDVLHCSLWK